MDLFRREEPIESFLSIYIEFNLQNELLLLGALAASWLARR